MIEKRGPDGLTKTERETLWRTRYSDPAWRMNNLYRIVDEHGKERQFTMRPAQAELFAACRMDAPDHTTRNIILKARQLGFTTFIDIFGLDLCLWNRNIRAGIIAHTREDAAIIFRDKIQYAYNHLPPHVRSWFPAQKNDAGELLLAHNSGVRVGTSFRSATAQFLHISEYGAICARYPKKANEIKTGALPAVHAGGYVFIESTAKGNEGEFYQLCMRAQQDAAAGRRSSLSFRFHFFAWWESDEYKLPVEGVVIPARLTEYFDKLEAKAGVILPPDRRAWYAETERNLGADMKQEHPSTPEEAFEQSIEGAYYRTQMDRAYAEDRVTEGRVEPGIPVNTAWDIGHGDSTAIWFFQGIGNQIRLVDYYENSGEGLEHYAAVLRERQYNYGRHFGPFDLQVHEWTSGKTRIESAAIDHGIKFEVAPDVGLADGIEIVRKTLANCMFWESRCEQGVKCLTNYRKDWDAVNGTWKSTPRHDWASHGADSFRYLCLAWRHGMADGGVSIQQPGATGQKWGW